jgi:3-hydroxybutyryl-CoA dehydrogenase
LQHQKICVIGAGVMGQGIAQACAVAGYNVGLCDIDHSLAVKAIDRIASSLSSSVAKGKMTEEDKLSILGRIGTISSLDEAQADVLIEAIIENLDLKRELFARLEKNNPQSILATNTSTFPVTEVARELAAPGRCIGIHFFNPAPVMKLVEVIAGRATTPATTAAAIDFVKSLGKIPVTVNDSPGFIVNRVARAFYLESLKILEEGPNGKEAVDALLRSSGFRMGPFELMDLIGIDTNLAVTGSLYEAFGRPEKFKPSAIQEAMVQEGRLGVKTGRGFYEYPR